jgi:hypothetical protein
MIGLRLALCVISRAQEMCNREPYVPLIGDDVVNVYAEVLYA